LSSIACINKSFANYVVSDDVIKKILEQRAIKNKQLIDFIKKNKPVSICARVSSVINKHKLLDQEEVDTLLLQGASEGLINTIKQCLALNANVNVRSKFRRVNHQGKIFMVSLEPLDEQGFVGYHDFFKQSKNMLINGADHGSRFDQFKRLNSLPLTPLPYFGRTPLAYAVINNQTKVVQLLIDYNADLNKANANGEPPLIEAVKHNNIAMVRLLIKAGADRAVKNVDGKDAISIAHDRGLDEIVKVLKAE
jgi:ankyrin repeat protein